MTASYDCAIIMTRSPVLNITCACSTPSCWDQNQELSVLGMSDLARDVYTFTLACVLAVSNAVIRTKNLESSECLTWLGMYKDVYTSTPVC